MILTNINRILRCFGYEVAAAKTNATEHQSSYDSPYSLYQYLKADGSFDYESYREQQEITNRTKIDRVWATEEGVRYLSDYIRKTVPEPRFGICHGTRRGKEQEWFRQSLGCEVIGTEISSTASDFPYTIQWDFHDVKPEWRNSVDFIYSNSFDHSYDPEKCLNAWMSCVTEKGLCILEHCSHNDRPASKSDPFGCDIFQLLYCIARWGHNRYGVSDLINAPILRDDMRYNYFVVIRKFPME